MSIVLPDLEPLWNHLASEFVLGEESIHGPAHWRRVERHAVCAARASGGDVLVARLFAVFHDACRVNDNRDDDHGARGAALAVELRGRFLPITNAQLRLLCEACTWHTAGQVTDDPTIGACWDADRLDLSRAAIIPDPRYMSTAYARALAAQINNGRERR